MAPTFAIATDATKRELRLSREAGATPINQAAWLAARACQGAGVVGVVVGLTAGCVVLVVGPMVLGVPVGVVVLVVDVAAVVVVVFVVVVVVVAAVLVAVVVGVVVVVAVVVVGLVFFFTFAEPPKNVVGWPLPVIERPARRSGTV
jgi:hypothetical protein